jgi:membrane-bound lytic murein transglycosylase A
VPYFYKLIICLVVVLTSCSRNEIKRRDEAMRKTEAPLDLAVSGGEDLRKILIESRQALFTKGSKTLDFGACAIDSKTYDDYLSRMPSSGIDLVHYLQKETQWFEVYGKEKWSEILLTSYFSPVYEGRRKPTPPFTQPLYNVPEDLIEVSLGDFNHADLAELKTDRPVVSARLRSGPGILKRVVPYYSRQEIDQLAALKGQKLELAYVRPIDAFFLHIQGSGKVRFPNGELLSLGYGAQNGHRYKSIGKLLYDVIPKEEMSMARIEGHLVGLNHGDLYDFLSENPSYIFFRELEGKKGVTTSGLEVMDRRTLAIDTQYFPLGAVAFLNYPHPNFENDLSVEPKDFENNSRLVFAHDTGGAIKGPGRADLYWGEGRKARQAAGVMKHPARLYFLGPKGACL